MSGHSPYDPQILAELQAINPDDGGAFVGELIDIFLRDTPASIAGVETALAAADHAVATRHAHSIKGSSGNFGAHALADVARVIEQAAKTGDLATAASQLPALKARYAELEAALRQVRQNPSASA